eukprot:gnl/TRDRNA2_/TRDRNA2_82163_c2_seq1.p1 gnl/TRDRNA2_/TRDRNA2_82163_c2~~gnl/TRDRNA2_/TRDRNA2_82163_c2_seq1.p1  ORF type:complete len:565 (+),score=109.16 gnl/TRDRNA2_/TRDRNA2_82163_c2_seq1:242-1696(+)
MTESIAGIRDARFQTMMPDALNWMGIRRIDWLCSMSNEKYEAITGAGITVMQRVSLPEDYVKDSMRVELDAKIASGYHSDGLSKDKIAAELNELGAIRKQCTRLYHLALKGSLQHFTLDESKLPAVVDVVQKTMQEQYPKGDVPQHSRLRHFGDESVKALLDSWSCDTMEKTRRLVDLITISVLLDAGAGPDWRYTAKGAQVSSSEGIALASLDMFLDGVFSSDPAMKNRVNSMALKALTTQQLSNGLQVSRSNPINGLVGRHQVLRRLGDVLESNHKLFGAEVHRPGHLVDYLMANVQNGELSLGVLWAACSEGFSDVWPTQPNGILRGDVWTHSKLQLTGIPGSDLVPFHKLSQWLVYSLIDVLDLMCGVKVSGAEQLTCLAEYRNGGLLVDLGVVQLRDSQWLKQEVNIGTELVVEWRALTVVLVDHIAEELRKRLGKSAEQLPLTKVLQGGTWQAGRSVARSKRTNGLPPIVVRSDGTVF